MTDEIAARWLERSKEMYETMYVCNDVWTNDIVMVTGSGWLEAAHSRTLWKKFKRHMSSSGRLLK